MVQSVLPVVQQTCLPSRFTKIAPLFTNTRRPIPKKNPRFLAGPANIKEECAASGPFLNIKYMQLAPDT